METGFVDLERLGRTSLDSKWIFFRRLRILLCVLNFLLLFTVSFHFNLITTRNQGDDSIFFCNVNNSPGVSLWSKNHNYIIIIIGYHKQNQCDDVMVLWLKEITRSGHEDIRDIVFSLIFGVWPEYIEYLVKFFRWLWYSILDTPPTYFSGRSQSYFIRGRNDKKLLS